MEEANTLYDNATYSVEQLSQPIPILDNGNTVGFLNYVVINKTTGAQEYFSEHLPGAISSAIKMDDYVVTANREKINATVVSLSGVPN